MAQRIETPMSKTKKQTNYGGQMYSSIIEIRLNFVSGTLAEKKKYDDRRDCKGDKAKC